MNIAFIGTGIMGAPMAGHLIDAGHSVVVHSRTRSKCGDLESRGARWVKTPADAAKQAEVVCLCLPDTPDVQKVVTADNGVLAGAKKGLVVVDHSTISPIATRSLAEMLAGKGVALLDAPVSGGDVGARNGTLSIMVGGDKDALQKAEPALRAYGKTITHTGGPGTGQFTKLVNQVLVSVTLAGVCEALMFAKKNGLDLEKSIEATSGGAAASWQLANLGPRIVNNDFRPGFMVDLLQKDLRILLDCASASSTSLPVASIVHQLFSAAQAAGHGRDGTQSLFTVMEKLGNVH
jgi:3-hydroxyisobutyrate dehydrogenase